jgi:hypothetical protein
MNKLLNITSILLSAKQSRKWDDKCSSMKAHSSFEGSSPRFSNRLVVKQGPIGKWESEIKRFANRQQFDRDLSMLPCLRNSGLSKEQCEGILCPTTSSFNQTSVFVRF